MYDTARRVALVKQRVRENTRRRQRREAISLSAVVSAVVRGADARAAGTLIAAGTDRRMGRVRRDAAAGGRGRLCAGGRRLLCSGGGRSPRCASGSETRKTREKTGQISPTRHEKEEKSQ